MKTLRKNQFGDTIIEVLLAITVLSIVLGISYSLASRGYRTLQVARDHMQATLLAQEQAEALRAVRDSSSDWTDFINTQAPCTSPYYFVIAGTDPNQFWQPNTTITDINGFTTQISCVSDPNTYTANVTVDWDQIGNGTPQTVTVVTILRNTF